MSTFQSIQQSIAPELQMLNNRISTTLASPNALMNQVIEGYLKSKGKQIRPIIVILSAKLLGEVNENVISAATAVELLHNATLIHDDVVDDTKLRRGQPTINNIWDNHIAVLVGDFFLSSALLQAIETNDIKIIKSITNLGKLLSIGEIDQIYNARFHNLNEDAYFETIYRKTASLFVSCVEVGAFAVGASDDDTQCLARVARLLGLCFQIKDDIFDYFNDEKIGKPTGNDLREGKITLPLLHVLLNDTLPQHDEMLALSKKEILDTDEINTLIEYAKQHGGIEYAYDTMQRLRDEAVEIISQFPESQTRDYFIAIIDYIISRDK
ncbi:MAG: polyprenyl synthetase family protein [Muribaculaceae bacterium]|nr:polyprenyl synthetase family protein [Muribaculaceae bacterium]MBR3766180.1 polyprenyl synthetase family protein [Muribaculaceae bacterium]